MMEEMLREDMVAKAVEEFFHNGVADWTLGEVGMFALSLLMMVVCQEPSTADTIRKAFELAIERGVKMGKKEEVGEAQP